MAGAPGDGDGTPGDAATPTARTRRTAHLQHHLAALRREYAAAGREREFDELVALYKARGIWPFDA